MRDEKYNILVRKPEGERLLGDLGTDRRILLKWILEIQGLRVWTEFSWFRVG
jgi:hypothetical protein